MMNYNYGFNPLLNAQQRMNFMEQPQGFITLPVSNIQEANSFRVSMDGTPTYFHNMGTGEIYVKRNNRQTGLCDFETYTKLVPTQVDGITLETLNQKIDGIYDLLMPVKKQEIKEVKNDK